ncbi:MAG TPA: sulfatase-like hydrolase/transferase [Planctomycetota bacterium]
MKRASFLVLLAACGGGADVVDNAPKKPSFVLMVADDQRWDTIGHPILKTPNLDRLASEGVLFRNAFVTTSICAISRASIMSGRLARNHKVGDFATALPEDVATFPAILKKGGWRTGCFGKWGIGGKPPADVFDVWDAWGGQGAFFHGETHNSEWLARRAEEFIQSTPRGQPFCLVILFKAPHDPYQPDPRDAELFKEVDFPAPASDWAKLPDFLRTSEARTRHDKWTGKAGYAEFVRNYLRCVAGVDRAVGKITGAIDAAGRGSETLVAYTSDNGFLLGEHGLIEKWQMWEESIRVPLIVKAPWTSPSMRGRKVDAMALNIDLAPTIVDWSGEAAPAEFDGRSLRRLLVGQASSWRTEFLYEHHFHYGGKIPRTEGLRTERWKYVTYFDVNPPFEQLFDLKEDPREQRNLALEGSDQLATMRTRYRQAVGGLAPPVVPK